MSGIAGIAAKGNEALVDRMLARIGHRGPVRHSVVGEGGVTLGLVTPPGRTKDHLILHQDLCARDGIGKGHLAEAQRANGGVTLRRDALGVAPLYYGHTHDGQLAFASEVKALLGVAESIRELPPGHTLEQHQLRAHFQLAPKPFINASPAQIASALRSRLSKAIHGRIVQPVMGSWLSGGLDSSAIAALARPQVSELHTFAAGFVGAPDLVFARDVAAFIGTEHHEIIVTLPMLLSVLPDVIYHLESFDALLVRSSTTNYLVARLAAQYVTDVFSGEGGDELFAGYEYLKNMPTQALPAELIDIMGRLHNTALQRVDRSAAAHGTVAHVPFTDPEVVDFALRIPPELKLRDGVEKWILRQALVSLLPGRVLWRTKAKFWEGAGVQGILAQHAESVVSDRDFRQERVLPNGWRLNSKEELFYYRIFREHFGTLQDLTWMGRTKGAPSEQ